MKQMRNWGAITRGLAALTTVTFVAAGMAFGQAWQGMTFQVPSQFKLGSKMLPAGTYTFSAKGLRLKLEAANGTQFSSSIVAELSGPS